MLPFSESPRHSAYDPDICNSCLLKSKYTEGKSGRAVNRNFDEEYFEKVKGYYGLAAYKKAVRKRKVWIEPMFGEARHRLGMERMRLRMLERVNCEALLTASGQNTKRLLTFGRGYYGLAAYKKAVRKRKVWIEPMFGEARHRLGMERMRLRMLERVNCEALLTASGQNTKRLLTFGRHGTRRPAQVTALRPPERPRLLPVHHLPVAQG